MVVKYFFQDILRAPDVYRYVIVKKNKDDNRIVKI